MKVGTIVTKARPYSLSEYCYYGGGPDELPIGSRGIIKEVRSRTEVVVQFDNGPLWAVHPAELLAVSSLAELRAKQRVRKQS